MAPKPGFYYYDSVRAFRVYLFLAVFGIGIHLSKIKLPSTEEMIELSLRYFIGALVVILALILLVFLVRRVIEMLMRELFPEKQVQRINREKAFSGFPTRRNSEPLPTDYESREEFIAALREYSEHREYQPGWVYYRSKELWPV